MILTPALNNGLLTGEVTEYTGDSFTLVAGEMQLVLDDDVTLTIEPQIELTVVVGENDG